LRVVLLIPVVTLISCGPALATPEVRPTPSATIVVDTDTPAPPIRAATPTPTPFVPKAVIKIIVDSPLSGNQALFGRDILRGAELAIQKLADPLMERGFQIDLVSYDDRNNLETALANTKEIVADPEILCAIGHFTPRLTVQVSQLYHQAGLALFAPTTTSLKLTEDGYREINRVIGREDLQGIAGADFAKAQGFTNVYIISQKDEYGLRNAENFRLQADDIGIQVLGMFITDLITDPALVLKDMLAANPELVYYAGRADHAIPFFKEARAAGYKGAFLGLDDLNNPPMMESAGPSLVKNGSLYFTILTAPANFYPAAAQFIQDFEIHYGSGPLLFATRAYDAAGICIKAIEIASKAKGGKVPTRAEVVNAIRTLKDYKGITGTYTFNDQGDPTRARYYVYRVVSVDAAKWDQNSIIASYEVAPP
jgi:branched-chain amino acid transport system substrate-binding protein